MPPVQNYENHRYLPKPTVVAFVLWVAALGCFIASWFGQPTLGAGLLLLMAAVLVLIAITRLYTAALQDRIIRLEMHLRCARLLDGAAQHRLAHLSKDQLVALRFASDEELPRLLDRAAAESLTGDQIKRAVRNWVPDMSRT